MSNIHNAIFWIKNNVFRQKAVREYQLSLSHITLDQENVDKINWEKRKKIVDFAYNNSSFYHRFYDEHHFHPSMLCAPSDWEKIPILEKDMIRFHTDDIHTVDYKYLRKNTTSGSTGQPLTCYHDSRFHQEILEWRMYKIWHVSPADNIAKIWRIPQHWSSLSHKLKDKLVWFPTKRLHFDATGVFPAGIERFINDFNKQGGIINGYAGTIAEIARYIVSNNLQIIKPELIVVFASPISDIDKKVINKAFHNAGIVDLYCCNEVSFIAFNCSQSNNLHINWDYRHIDLINDNKLIHNTGVMGDILLTDLSNYGFPIIKYRIGDRTCWATDHCTCGCSLPSIAPVKGRISDHIKLPNGGFISGEWLTTIFDDYPNAVRCFRICQNEDFSLELEVIPNKPYPNYKSEVEAVATILSTKANGLFVQINEVDEMPTERGKHRYVVHKRKTSQHE